VMLWERAGLMTTPCSTYTCGEFWVATFSMGVAFTVEGGLSGSTVVEEVGPPGFCTCPSACAAPTPVTVRTEAAIAAGARGFE